MIATIRSRTRSGERHFMNRDHYFRAVLVLIFLSLAGVFSTQGTSPAQSPPDKVFIVNGKTLGAKALQIAGRSYVDIEALAEALKGVVTVKSDLV
jgi:hypothetical protein